MTASPNAWEQAYRYGADLRWQLHETKQKAVVARRDSELDFLSDASVEKAVARADHYDDKADRLQWQLDFIPFDMWKAAQDIELGGRAR
jgi:hypothetical protein